jgi:hypothetical protein
VVASVLNAQNKTYKLDLIACMNPFVNYQNRSIELPEGCKDLIDVLKPNSPSKKPSPNVRLTLADLATYVSRFLESHAKTRSLWIYGGATAVVGMARGKERLGAIIFVNLAREQAVRDIFSDSGMVSFGDNSLPNNMRSLHYELSAISDIERFIRELLMRGFGVTEDTSLRFSYREKD